MRSCFAASSTTSFINTFPSRSRLLTTSAFLRRLHCLFPLITCLSPKNSNIFPQTINLPSLNPKELFLVVLAFLSIFLDFFSLPDSGIPSYGPCSIMDRWHTRQLVSILQLLQLVTRIKTIVLYEVMEGCMLICDQVVDILLI